MVVGTQWAGLVFHKLLMIWDFHTQRAKETPVYRRNGVISGERA